MRTGLSNWQNFKSPHDSLDTFTRHEPFGDELKATYVGGTKRPGKRSRKACSSALEKRWRKRR